MAQLPAAFAVSQVTRVIAEKTLLAIELALDSDGGNLYRKFLRDTVIEAEGAYQEVDNEFRTHLGASQMGRECNRELWYGFRWATAREDREEWHKGVHDGVPCTKCRSIKSRMVRLLNRGQLEEARFIALLLMIGVEVWTHDEQGNQFRVSLHGGHAGGSSDSVVRGIPDLPLEPMLAEMKTHKDDSFDKLKMHGLRESKPEHYVQMQIYMGGMNLKYGFYFAVNKDNDDLYAEIIEFNQEFYTFHTERAKKVILAVLPPPKISENSGWYKCKFCNSRAVCHKLPDVNGNIPSPLRNCRTCVYSQVNPGNWSCEHPERSFKTKGQKIILSKKDQMEGCSQYVAIQGM